MRSIGIDRTLRSSDALVEMVVKEVIWSSLWGFFVKMPRADPRINGAGGYYDSQPCLAYFDVVKTPLRGS